MCLRSNLSSLGLHLHSISHHRLRYNSSPLASLNHPQLSKQKHETATANWKIHILGTYFPGNALTLSG